MRRLSRFLIPLGVLAAFAFPSAAMAVHNADKHSANTSLVFSAVNGTNAINSDIAFWGNRAYYGDYDGFRIFDISNPASPVLLRDFDCRGPQNDPAVWGNLLFLAIDRTQTGPNCGSTNTAAHDDPNGWEGVRIFNVSNPAAPVQVGSVYTDCGAHTITVNPVSVGTIHLWVSSYPLRPGPTCGPVRGPAAGRHPHHGVIQIIEVPLANPSAAREIAEPPITYPGDPDNAFNPAEHDLAGFLTLRACHDIAINVPLRLAAAACAEQAQLWRIGANGIPDTANPVWTVDDTTDTDGAGGGDVAVDFWHSATFSWDGKLVNFIDESFGSGCPTVTPVGLGAAAKPSDTGRMFFVNTATGAFLSRFTLPRPETSPIVDYCSAHLGNTVPSIGKYLLVNAWYTGGIDVIDFTNPSSPLEVAYYDVADRDNPAPQPDVLGGDNWSAYWYENTAGDDDNLWLFATDGVENPPSGEGAQVYRTSMAVEDVGLRRLNPQTQEDLIRCRATVSPGNLRAREARSVNVRVSVVPGVSLLPGQMVGNVPVRLRGPGVSIETFTNANGVARVSGVAPTRKGTLRATVRSLPNLIGCLGTARIRAPRAGVVAGGAGLTGRPS